MVYKNTCVIVDDETKAIELLEDNLRTFFPNIEVKSTHSNWRTAYQAIQQNDFDILFLDISLPEKTGFDILSLSRDLKCEVIFVTAYSEFALEAFKHHAAGYILKPIDESIFINTISKCLNRLAIKKETSPSLIGIPNHQGINYVNINNIIYFEAKNRYTLIKTDTTELLSSYNVGLYKDLTKDNPNFIQIHRSYILNVTYINRYNNDGTITLKNGVSLPVSKSYKKLFKPILENQNNT